MSATDLADDDDDDDDEDKDDDLHVFDPVVTGPFSCLFCLFSWS